ncbi:hypothetical protein GQ457_07G011100 [Hibiscus cannabinus]
MTNLRENVSDITLRSGTLLSQRPERKIPRKKDQVEEPLPTKQDTSNPNTSSFEVQSPFPSKPMHIKEETYWERKSKSGTTCLFRFPTKASTENEGPRYVKIQRTMCDLGASINAIPLSIYKMITNDPLKDTKVTIQLADRLVINLEGLLENVLLEVDELIFPIDFYVINMENDQSNTSLEILLGLQFFSTANIEIEVRSGLLTMAFDGEIVKFDVYKSMEHPYSMPSVNCVNTFKPSIDEHSSSDKFYMNLNVETVKAREMDIASKVDSRSSCNEISRYICSSSSGLEGACLETVLPAGVLLFLRVGESGVERSATTDLAGVGAGDNIETSAGSLFLNCLVVEFSGVVSFHGVGSMG